MILRSYLWQVIWMTEINSVFDRWLKGLGDGKRLSLGRVSNLWWLLIMLGGGVALLILTGSFVNPSASNTTHSEPPKETVQNDDSLTKAEKELELRLERILGAVEGAGSVKVTVTLSSGEENVFAQNLNKQNRVIEEKDQAGGNRKTTEISEQGSLVFAETLNGGKNDPVIVKTKSPEVAGVLVLAEGAKDPELRETLAQAVETLLNIPSYKVTVLAKESR